MSILIRNIEFPKSCHDCFLCLEECWGAYRCMYVKKWGDDTTRAEDCPLVEVPEHHGRLVDLDKLIDDMGLNEARKYGNKTARDRSFSYGTLMRYEIADALEDTPVIIDKE